MYKVTYFQTCIHIYQLQERDEKEHELTKVTAELSALGVAAKQGMEAATKVKTLETDNKKLTEENKVLTENYNSERVSVLLYVLFLYSSTVDIDSIFSLEKWWTPMGFFFCGFILTLEFHYEFV